MPSLGSVVVIISLENNKHYHPFQCPRQRMSMNTWKNQARASHEDEQQSTHTLVRLSVLVRATALGCFARVETEYVL